MLVRHAVPPRRLGCSGGTAGHRLGGMPAGPDRLGPGIIVVAGVPGNERMTGRAELNGAVSVFPALLADRLVHRCLPAPLLPADSETASPKTVLIRNDGARTCLCAPGIKVIGDS
jgi:hypothetical protein